MEFDEKGANMDMRMRELAKANRGSGNEKNVIASCFQAKREADTFMMDDRRPLKLQLLPPSVRSLQLLLADGNTEPTPIPENLIENFSVDYLVT